MSEKEVKVTEYADGEVTEQHGVGIPKSLIIFAVVLIVWAVWYLVRYWH